MPELDDAALAARYGWALSVLNSDPSLRDTFRRAVREDWAAERFVAEVRNTPWYKNNSESMRQAVVLKNSDPATWQQRLSQMVNTVSNIAWQVGARLDPGIIAEQALTFGWNENQIRDAMRTAVQHGDVGFYGQAAQHEASIREFANAMGVRLSDSTMQTWVQDVAVGRNTVDGFRSAIQNMAISAFPHLKDRLEAGETVASIADPYRQAMGQILEINPESVDVFDPTIRGALANRTKDGQPATKTLWEFENDLRKDNRWLKTSNAREQAMGTARQVLSDFGLAV